MSQMSTLKIEFTDFYKIAISSDSQVILDYFRKSLCTKYTETFRIKTKNGGMKTIEKVKDARIFQDLKTCLLVNAGLIDYIVVSISELYRMYGPEKMKFESFLPNIAPLDLNEKWRNIFASHPRGEMFAKNQLEDYPKITSSFGGTAELFTGYGKTELILSIADNFIEQYPGNVVLIAPDNAILDEIYLRSKKYEVPVGLKDWTKRINVINPVGFMRSKALTSEAREWMADVQLALTDESHHLSADSWMNLFAMLKSLIRSYGFSASLDVGEGQIMSPGTTTIDKMGPKNSRIVGLSGALKVRRRLPVPVSLLRVNHRVADKDKCRSAPSWMDAFDHTVTDMKFAADILTIMSETDRIFFIPIYKKESGLKLHHNLVSLGSSSVYWTSNELLINGEKIDTDSPLAYIKEFMKKTPARTFISTRFEGIDIPRLDGIIPLMGTSHRMTIQPVGRSARNEDVLVVLMYDKNNPIVLHQSKIRRDRVEKEYDIVSSRLRSLD